MSPTRLPTQLHRALAPELARVSEVRHSVSALLRRWGAGKPLADDVQLVISELVANAVVRGSGRVVLTIAEIMGHITVKVSDANHAHGPNKHLGARRLEGS
ncbi:ATP-binding protein [Streptomyces chartreusis]